MAAGEKITLTFEGGKTMGALGDQLTLRNATHDAIAIAFAEKHAGKLCWCQEWKKWLRWDGLRWEPDRTVHTQDDIRKFLRTLNFTNDTESKKLLNQGMVKAIESLAKTDRRLAVIPDEFDSDEFLLNPPDGIVDLRTGEVTKNNPAFRMKLITKTGLGKACPVWRQFLNRVTNNRKELVDFLQIVVGSCLTGCTREHALFFLYGTGANGKSTFLDTIRWILGDYARSAPMELFIKANYDRHPTEHAALFGARMITANETEQGRHWAEARIKNLTGGDVISARFMRGDFFEFKPSFKIMLAGNHKPKLKTVDEAIKMRLHLTPFAAEISSLERDSELPRKLQEESSGILSWAIEGSQKWYETGLQVPTLVVDETDEYFQSQDVLQQWLAERCQTGPRYSANPTCLYKDWEEWANGVGENPGSAKEFSADLERNGFAAGKSNGKRLRRGLKLKE